MAWDVFAPEPLSEAFRRVSSTPAGRATLIGVWGLLTLHLFDVIPSQTDPFHWLLVGLKGEWRKEANGGKGELLPGVRSLQAGRCYLLVH